jgi:tetratricopeptide (TPR) repeat protein
MNELNRVNIYRDKGKGLDSVIERYDKLQNLYSDNEYILIQKGICQQSMKNYKGAIDCYVKVLKKNPNNVEAQVLLEGCKVIGDMNVNPKNHDVVHDFPELQKNNVETESNNQNPIKPFIMKLKLPNNKNSINEIENASIDKDETDASSHGYKVDTNKFASVEEIEQLREKTNDLLGKLKENNTENDKNSNIENSTSKTSDNSLNTR